VEEGGGGSGRKKGAGQTRSDGEEADCFERHKQGQPEGKLELAEERSPNVLGGHKVKERG